MSSELAIRVEGLSKSFPIYEQPMHRLYQMLSPRKHKQRWFRQFQALKNINLGVRRGETLGVVGRNGSGKSTLLQLICGTLTPSAGDVQVTGRIAALLELGAGFNPDFTGRENVLLYGTVLGLTRQQVEDRFDEIIAFADIGDFVDQPVKCYSSGMYVRLAFAVAINVTPDILIVDEALSVGDEAFQRKCFARINRIRDSGATVLFVSHSANTVIELCDRAILLDRGELLAEGTPKYVVSRYQKMLYSPAEKAQSIRDSIMSGSEDCAITDTSLGGSAATGDIKDVPGAASKEIAEGALSDAAYYEEGMAPQSTLRYEPVGARIIDPHIETLDGRRVNILSPMSNYFYVYRVYFDRDAEKVRCGMLIKSITGLDLAGSITSWSGESLPYVAAGTESEIRFQFPCMFASGAYFLNAGVQGRVGEEEVYLDRWVDVAMFKVMHEPGKLATTTIDLGISCVISKASSTMASL
jgi:lipopolysaccharide transport system ATP-binding protein